MRYTNVGIASGSQSKMFFNQFTVCCGNNERFILFSMWVEAIKNFAEYGKGNVIFLDGGSDGMEKTMKQIMAMQQLDNNNSNNKK